MTTMTTMAGEEAAVAAGSAPDCPGGPDHESLPARNRTSPASSPLVRIAIDRVQRDQHDPFDWNTTSTATAHRDRELPNTIGRAAVTVNLA
jgi:hypothetical protein